MGGRWGGEGEGGSARKEVEITCTLNLQTISIALASTEIFKLVSWSLSKKVTHKSYRPLACIAQLRPQL